MSVGTAVKPTDSPTPSSGVTNAKLGIWLFLASEVMLFGTLFTTYLVLRMGAASWPRGWDVLNVPLGMVNTFVLITSSVTILLSYVAALEKNKAKFRAYMTATIALSFVFLVIKGFEYAAHFAKGEFPSTNIFNAVYFTMTGLHGFHVVCGIVVNTGLLYLSGEDFEHPLFAGRVEGAGLYWHFVDIVWIFLFPALYLL